MAEDKENSGVDLLQDADALADQINKSEEFIKKNKVVLAGVIGAIVLLVVGGIMFSSSSKEGNYEAQLELYPIQHYYSIDSLDVVINGNGQVDGALDVADSYSGSKAADLANFYAGVAQLKKGQYDDAIESLSKFDANDLVVQARAYSLIGDAYMEKGELATAITNYQKAVSEKSNEHFTPQYILKLALAQELNGNIAEAVKSYEDLINDYPKATEVNTAKKYKAKLSAQLIATKG